MYLVVLTYYIQCITIKKEEELSLEVSTMKTVQPIRSTEEIQAMKSELLKKGYRDYLLFMVGVNTGLRISDILKLKVSDVRGKTHITIKEQKTGKTKKALITQQLRQDLDNFTALMGSEEYLFQSRNGNNQPITRVQAYRILTQAAANVGLEEIGTHTLRKTFGYHHYQQNKDVALLQELFNHSAPSVTLRYIGINQDNMDESMKNFSL